MGNGTKLMEWDAKREFLQNFHLCCAYPFYSTQVQKPSKIEIQETVAYMPTPHKNHSLF